MVVFSEALLIAGCLLILLFEQKVKEDIQNFEHETKAVVQVSGGVIKLQTMI
jgi:hypothetical protein